MSGRRDFLRTAGALSALGVVQRARAIAPGGHTGSLQDVAHIVVLMQENRSFDHYFGALNGVRGFADPFPLPLAGGRSVWMQPREKPAAGHSPWLTPFELDVGREFALMRADGTPHRWPDAQQAWDHGRMAHWPAAKRNHAMSWFHPSVLPFQTALANAFTLCDAYHCSFQGGTHPNRYYLNTGTIDPLGQGRGPALYNDFEDFGKPGTDVAYRWTTYAERLQSAGISWHVYQDTADNFDDNSLAGFQQFRDAVHGQTPASSLRDELARRANSSGGLQRLRDDVLAGRLPQVSWIVGTAEGSEHPWKSSPAQGAAYVAQALEALTANPEVWSRTVLFVNYDENDGFFDHIPPPAVPALQDGSTGRSTVDTTGEYLAHLPAGHDGPEDRALLQRPLGLGPRVPMFVVSPWSRGGWVCSQVFDHTSVIRFMEARFGVPEPNISAWRRAVCGDLTAALDFRQAHRELAFRGALPETAPRAARARALPQTTTPLAPPQPSAPVQARGPRPARALPYAAEATCNNRESGQVLLQMRNPGRAALVLHVYDRLRPDALPRRYTLGAGESLADAWPCDAEHRHDFWLLGPNGWHRRFRGLAGPQALQLAWQLQPRGSQARAVLHLHNLGAQARTLRARSLGYRASGPHSWHLAPGASRELNLGLLPAHGWYDWVLEEAGTGELLLRCAGHFENGRPSITDPAMHGPALLDLDGPPGRPPAAT